MEKYVLIAIASPALQESLYNPENIKRSMDELPPKERILAQLEREYLPGYLLILDNLKTERNLVSLGGINYRRGIERDEFKNFVTHSKIDLAVSCCTRSVEDEITSFIGTGAVIARYSKFYGGISEYSGRNAAQSGYSLDLPKDPSIFKILLRNDDFLDALKNRDELAILSSLEEINGRIPQPIIATPYLTQTLNVKRNE